MKGIATATLVSIVFAGTALGIGVAASAKPEPAAPSVHQVEARIEADVDARLRILLPRLAERTLHG